MIISNRLQIQPDYKELMTNTDWIVVIDPFKNLYHYSASINQKLVNVSLIELAFVS